MYDFLTNNALYVVLIIVLVIWIGLFSYIWKIDREVKRLEGE